MKRVALIAVLAIMSLMSVGSAPAAAQNQNSLSVPIVGSGPLGSFAGTFTVKRFVATADGIGAIGTLSGTVTNAAGQATGILTNITLPVAIGTTTCEILHLDLGPLHLNLLGLEIDLSRVVLDVTAQAGAGNLLGNLLCAAAGLLDNPSGLAKLLNQILSILG
jgi:hypothetical protein